MNIFLRKNNDNIFIKKIDHKYRILLDEIDNKLISSLINLFKKEKIRIDSKGLNIDDEPLRLLKNIDHLLINVDFKSNILLKYLCEYDKSIDIKNYEHINYLIEKILEKLNNKFYFLGNINNQLMIFKISFRVHNIGRLFVPKILFDKNIILDEKNKNILKNQLIYTKEILEDLNFPKEIINICTGNKEIDECYLTDLRQCKASLESRIILILDKYFALISDKPYREKYSKNEALEVIRNEMNMDSENIMILDMIKNFI